MQAFGDEPVKQSKVEKLKPKNTELNIHDDCEFEKTLMELDEELLTENIKTKTEDNEGIYY